jgi:hypothetical protein
MTINNYTAFNGGYLLKPLDLFKRLCKNLLSLCLPFRLRIKANQKIHDGQKSLYASIVFSHLGVGQSEVLSGRRWVWGRLVYLSALRLDDGELLIIISDDSPTTAIFDYARRWGIETLRVQL